MFHRRIHPSQKKDFKSSQLRYASRTYGQYQITVKLLGSFRLTAGNRHLHRYCIFTEQVSETVLQSLHFSTRGNLPRKELRYILLFCISLCSTNSILSSPLACAQDSDSDVWFLRISKIEIFSFYSSSLLIWRPFPFLSYLNEYLSTSLK